MRRTQIEHTQHFHFPWQVRPKLSTSPDAPKSTRPTRTPTSLYQHPKPLAAFHTNQPVASCKLNKEMPASAPTPTAETDGYSFPCRQQHGKHQPEAPTVHHLHIGISFATEPTRHISGQYSKFTQLAKYSPRLQLHNPFFVCSRTRNSEHQNQLEGNPSLSKNARFRSIAALVSRS